MNTSHVGYAGKLADDTVANTDYRHVIYTGKNMQLVLMTLQVEEEIGEEVHDTHDQFFRVEAGIAEVEMNGEKTTLNADDAAIVPAGAKHNVRNVGNELLKLYTIYAPPQHPDGTVQATRPAND